MTPTGVDAGGLLELTTGGAADDGRGAGLEEAGGGGAGLDEAGGGGGLDDGGGDGDSDGAGCGVGVFAGDDGTSAEEGGALDDG